MRFVQSTPTQLIAHNSVLGTRLLYSLPLVLGLVSLYSPVLSVEEHFNNQFFGYIFACFGLFSLLKYGRAVTWLFNKDDKTLTVRNRFMLVSKTSVYSLTDISCVEIESEVTGEDGTLSFGISLHITGGEELHLYRRCSLSEYTAREAVLRISNFLKF